MALLSILYGRTKGFVVRHRPSYTQSIDFAEPHGTDSPQRRELEEVRLTTENELAVRVWRSRGRSWNGADLDYGQTTVSDRVQDSRPEPDLLPDHPPTGAPRLSAMHSLAD